MTRIALFVDLTNFYTQLVKSDILGSPKDIRSYFTEWFDFGLLSQKLSGTISDVWIFHSDKLGPKEARIDGKFLTDLINKLNSQKGVTARNVNIKGEQREPLKITCDNCNKNIDADWKSEKGIDSTLIVHLFDTMDSWDEAYLLSGDADFVPAVTSLRRRGKVIKGAGFPSKSSSALVRECFEYIDLMQEFICDDYYAYRFCKKDGILWEYLTDIESKDKLGNDIKLRFFQIQDEETGEIKITLESSTHRNLEEWSQKRTSLVNATQISVVTHGNGDSVYKFHFDALFSPKVSTSILGILSKKPFDEQVYNYDSINGGRITDMKIMFKLHEKNKCYELFQEEQLVQTH